MPKGFLKRFENYLLKSNSSKSPSFFRKHFFPNSSNNFTPTLTSNKSLIAITIALLVVSLFSDSFLGISAQSRLINLNTQQIISLTNAKRAENNLESLTENALLTEAAFLKTQDMLEKDYWQHNSPGGEEPWDFIDKTGYTWIYAGENLAKGFENAEEVVEAWMNSQTHRENLLNPDYTEIGVAVSSGKLDGEDLLLVVQMFATPFELPDDVGVEIDPNISQPLQTKEVISRDLTPPIVSVDIKGGTYNKDLSLSLSANEEAKIYYTLNGKEPDNKSNLYTRSLNLSSSRILKFFAIDQSGNESEIQTEKYLIKKLDTTKPVILTPTQNSYVNSSKLTISGNAYLDDTVLIKVDNKLVGQVETRAEKYAPFTFETELKDGNHEISVELLNKQRVSDSNTVVIDTKAPTIQVDSLNLKAEKQDLVINYDLSVKVEGDPSKVQLVLPDEKINLTEFASGVYSCSFSLESGRTQTLASIYAEDLAQNLSSTTISISGNVGETLGVINSNTDVTENKLIFSQALKSSLKNVSLVIMFLITFSLLLSAFVYYRKGLKYKSKHALTHATIIFLLILALIFI
ncbi:MAG: CAP domain-containing protein [Candidatus Gracilibacteria bacterium]|nr:CAP domain-containing protein [Candidatus Gracilibacteria bacterium]